MGRRFLRNSALVACALASGFPAPMTSAWAQSAAARVDVQMSLCDTPQQLASKLALRPQGKPSQVWLFDDTDLSLFAKGLRIRLRETGQGAELTLKAAGQDCARLPAEILAAGEGKCEYDLHGTKIAGALSLTRMLDADAARQLAAEAGRLSGLLNAAQRRFLGQVPGAWPLPTGLQVLGPARVTSYRVGKLSYALDVSELPGGERFVEISVKVQEADAQRRRDQMAADLAQAGVSVCADQSAQAINKLRALLPHG